MRPKDGTPNLVHYSLVTDLHIKMRRKGTPWVPVIGRTSLDEQPKEKDVPVWRVLRLECV